MATADQAVTFEFGTGTLGLAQFEPGSGATAFERRAPGVELALCQRYFWVSNPMNPTGGGTGMLYGFTPPGTTTILVTSVRFPVAMRVSPTVTLYSSGSVNNVRRTTSGSAYSMGGDTPTIAVSPSGFGFITAISGLVASEHFDFDAQASAELCR